MLVKGPAPDSGVQDVPLKAPAAPAEGQFQTRELPLVTPPLPAGGALGMPAAQPESPAVAAAGSALPPAVAGGDYAVNFGAYASQADADAVIAHLLKSNLPGFRQPDTVNGRPAWRVRIGPYRDRAQAELVRLEAGKVRNDVNAQVVVLNADAPAPAPVGSVAATQPVRTEALPPAPARPVAAAPKPEPKPEAPRPAPARPVAATPAPAPTPAPPAAAAASSVGFAVQLGAFAQAADATALRDRARAAGFSAFVEQVRTDNGVLSRVRVGPVASRADAEQLKAQVAARIGIAGMVRPHP